ncbi:MAG: TRAP transporter large permease subunit [bacterium]|nr:TRAP transporter large permease subunit [bacterium]
MILKRSINIFRKIENGTAYAILFMVMLFPLIEAVAGKYFNTGVPNSHEYIQHLVLWVTFVGAMITSREGKHLALTAGVETGQSPAQTRMAIVIAIISSAIAFAVAWSSLYTILTIFEPDTKIGIFPARAVGMIMPIGYAVMAIRFITILTGGKGHKIIAAAGLLFGSFLALDSINELGLKYLALNADPDLALNITFIPDSVLNFAASASSTIAIPVIVILIISARFGTPIFILLGGVAYMLFMRGGDATTPITNDAYTMFAENSSIPAIPLFTFAGFILSESKAGERLVNFFKASLGWLPGGMAIAAVVVCAFFTTFTGASGITILALGGLLSYILVNSAKYSEDFANGLLTASGSIGLLFPPSLPIILYGVIAQISIKKMFLAGLVPGIFMVIVLSVMGVFVAKKYKLERTPLNLKNIDRKKVFKSMIEFFLEFSIPIAILIIYLKGGLTGVQAIYSAIVYAYGLALFRKKTFDLKKIPGAMRDYLPGTGTAGFLRKSGALSELLFPVIILVCFFGGIANLVETAAIAVFYSLIVALFVHKDLRVRELPQVMLKCIPIIGGILIILAVSHGLKNYIIINDIPMELAAWTKANIQSKTVFLILLNIALLITGCLMDIFSAITVVVPLIKPLGEAYGIDPVHLGIIFLANLELGYLTPPVGLNLFMASYRFNMPLNKIYKIIIPFFLLLLFTVLVITYVPWLSTGLVELLE